MLNELSKQTFENFQLLSTDRGKIFCGHMTSGEKFPWCIIGNSWQTFLVERRSFLLFSLGYRSWPSKKITAQKKRVSPGNVCWNVCRALLHAVPMISKFSHTFRIALFLLFLKAENWLKAPFKDAFLQAVFLLFLKHFPTPSLTSLS